MRVDDVGVDAVGDWGLMLWELMLSGMMLWRGNTQHGMA